MKITNRYNLPEEIVNAVKNDEYSRGDSDISISGLINPPQITTLMERHDKEIQIDASDHGWILLGKAVHKIFEAGTTDTEATVEKRLFAQVGGWKISGQFDICKGKLIRDYKCSGVYSVIGPPKPEWEAQLNSYAWLAHLNQIEVNELEIQVFIRDFMKSKVGVKPGYPPTMFHKVGIPMWPLQVADEFLQERVRLHRESRQLSDEAISRQFPCSDSERWKNNIRCREYCAVGKNNLCKQLTH